MIVPDFEIPLRLVDLEEPGPAGEFNLRDELSVSDVGARLSDAAKAESQDGADFIVEHFSTFYYLCKQFKAVPNNVAVKGYRLLLKSFKKTTVMLEGMLEEKLEPEVQASTRNVLKMLSYILIEVAKGLQEYHCSLAQDAKTKGKKNSKAEGFTEWVEEKNQLLGVIYSFLQLPVQQLWDPPVVDDEFIKVFANFCYKLLEDPSITGAALKSFRSSIFQVLSTLIRRYHHGLSFCVKVVQLLRMNEHLASPLAQGVVEVVNDGCGNVVRGIVQEVGELDEQLLSDASAARCLSQFLSQVAETSPEAAHPAVEMLVTFLGRDPPALRCCALSVLGEVVQALLTKDDLEQDLRNQRDINLDMLEEHIHDTNAFVRARALQVWHKLAQATAIPMARLHNLLELVIGRLGDKSSNVKKQAIQLIKALLEGNPYWCQLDVKQISKQLEEERKKLNHLLQSHNICDSSNEWLQLEKDIKKALQENKDSSTAKEGRTLQDAVQLIQSLIRERDVSKAVAVFLQLKSEFCEEMNMDGDDDSDTSLQALRTIWEQGRVVPDISEDVLEKKEKMETGVKHLEGTLEFATQIDRALPLILTLLDSPMQTDVLEAISFFTAAYQFGFSKAIEGVRRMLYLVFSKETSVKSAVCAAYQEVYFPESGNSRKRSVDAITNLCDLVIQLNLSQMDAIGEMMREWVRSGVVDNDCIRVMFERFSLKISGTTDGQSWAALALISMVGSEQPKVISSNMTAIVNEGLGSRGARNPVLAQYCCRALQKLGNDGRKLAADDEILLRLWRLLREGLWSSSSNIYYVPFADEALNLIYLLAERPDQFTEKLIVDLFLGIKNGKKPVSKQPRGRVLTNNQHNDLFDVEDEPSVEDKSIEESADADMTAEAVLLRMTRFVSILGTVAAQYVGFLDNRILGELRRRNLVEFERKKERLGDKPDDVSMGENELEFLRTANDDMNAEQIRNIAEERVVTGDGLLAKFLPFLVNINKQPSKFPSGPLQNAAFVALGMFMQVSSKLCDEHLPLVVTITEKSQSADKRRNGLLLLWALQFRHPNLLEPYTSHMFALLKDPEPTVRRTAVRVVTHLIFNEMVKARMYLSELAICIVDADVVIAQTTRHFFREYSQKPNALLSVLPTLIFNLTSPSLELDEEFFRTIVRFILDLATKDKQLELLVEKLCQYFKCATTDRQCRDLAFCMAQIQYSEKALRKVLENFPSFGGKLYLAEVYEAMTTILATAAKNPQKDKALVDELETLVQEYRQKSCADHNIAVTIPKRCPPSTKKRVPRRRQVSSESEPEDSVPKSTRKRQTRKKLPMVNSDSGSDNEAFVRNKRTRKVSSDSDSGESVKKSIKKLSTSKKTRGKGRSLVKSESDELLDRKLMRSSRKRL